MRIRAASQLRPAVGWDVPEEPGLPAEWPQSPRPVTGAAAWSSPLFSPGPLPVAWPHGQEGKALSAPAPMGQSTHSGVAALPTLWLQVGGSLPLGSLPASFTDVPDVPLTHPAPHGSDSAAPPDVRFPASVPAKEGVGDPCLSILLYLLALGSSYSQFHSPDFFGLFQTYITKGQGEESSDRNLGSQRETESSRNREHKPAAWETKNKKHGPTQTYREAKTCEGQETSNDQGPTEGRVTPGDRQTKSRKGRHTERWAGEMH